MSKAASFGPNNKASTRALKMILLLLVGRRIKAGLSLDVVGNIYQKRQCREWQKS